MHSSRQPRQRPRASADPAARPQLPEGVYAKGERGASMISLGQFLEPACWVLGSEYGNRSQRAAGPRPVQDQMKLQVDYFGNRLMLRCARLFIKNKGGVVAEVDSRLERPGFTTTHGFSFFVSVPRRPPHLPLSEFLLLFGNQKYGHGVWKDCTAWPMMRGRGGERHGDETG